MSNLDTINVGGIDFEIEDSTARADSAVVAYKENGNVASQAYAVIGTPINWKGTLYYTSATIAAGDTLAVGTNLMSAINIGKMLSNIKTYVGSDDKLHFTDATGADSVLPFKNSSGTTVIRYVENVWDGSNILYYTAPCTQSVVITGSANSRIWQAGYINLDSTRIWTQNNQQWTTTNINLTITMNEGQVLMLHGSGDTASSDAGINRTATCNITLTISNV